MMITVGHAKEFRPDNKWNKKNSKNEFRILNSTITNEIKRIFRKEFWNNSEELLLSVSRANCLYFHSAFPSTKNCCIYHFIVHSAGIQHFIYQLNTHPHTLSMEISFAVALRKVDCGILLNLIPIKTWHCLKHYQVMLSSVRVPVLMPSVFIRQRAPVFLFWRWNWQ